MILKPQILLAALSIFLFCLAFHIILWRLRHPKRHALTLLLTFFVPLFLVALFMIMFRIDVAWPTLAAVGLLHAAISCAYIQVYPASQADSPSLKVLLLVGKSMPVGMTENEIQASFNEVALLEARIQDLIDSGLAAESGGKLELSPRGRLLITPFILLRRMLGLDAGKG